MQQAIAPGTVIDKRYQIQKKLPDNTSNQCYLAEDTEQSNRLVVLSFPRMELQTLPGFTATFEDACQQLMKARLNGLLKILDQGIYESQPYAVLQYVTHETLENSLATYKNKEKKVSVDEVLDWARPLAVTLDELHELDYVHSNVRPSTIFLGQKRQVLLGDFITEFTVQRLGAFKQAIASLDIADHLAPEYIKSNYSESYDQYLLATIIYKILAGRSHFHNPGSPEAYRRQVATKFPEPLLTHRPELVGASRILGKALERNPVKRFDSCRDFVEQLSTAQVNPVFAKQDDKPVTVIKKVLDLDETAPADPIITSIRSDRKSGRKKGLVWLGVLLLGVGAGAYAINHFGGFTQFKDRLTTALADLTAEKKQPIVVQVDPATIRSQTEAASTQANAGSASSDADTAKANADTAAKNNNLAAQGTNNESNAADPTVVDSSNDPAVVDSSNAQANVGEQSQQSSVAQNNPNSENTASVPVVGTAGQQNGETSVDATSQSPEAGDTQTVVANVITPESISGEEGSTSTSLTALSNAEHLQFSAEVNQTLAAAEREFAEGQGNTNVSQNTEVTISAATIDEAINRALQDAELEHMRQASPAAAEANGNASGLSPDQSGLASENINALDGANATMTEGGDTQALNNAMQGLDQAGEASVDPTLANPEISAAEQVAQSLNEQMIAANKLADERAAAAKLAAEKKKREREARRKAREEAQRQAAQEALKQESASEEARANEVVSAPVVKSFEEMRKERERVQAIKAQKLARINSITKDCVTSGKIHRQVAAGNLPYVKSCLAVGVDPNLTQSNRWTLLHLASLGGYLNMAKLLVAKGANINAKAADGKTPLDMATEQNKQRLITYLRSRGGVTSR